MNSEIDAGWGKPSVSRKWHYFPAGEMFSLCRAWGFYTGPRDNGMHDHKDNCAQCKRLRNSQEKKADA